MKKILFLLVVFLPAVWAGSTYYSSAKNEEVFTQSIEQGKENLQNLTAIPVNFEQVSYEKGFLNSKAKTKLTIMESLLDEPLEVSFDHTIYNGPLLITPEGTKTGASYIRTTVDLSEASEEAKEIFGEIFKGEEPLVVTNTFAFDDNVETKLDIARFEFDMAELDKKFATDPDNNEKPEEGIMTFDGMQMHVNSDRAGKQINGDFSFGEILIDGEDEGKRINILMTASSGAIDIEELYRGAMVLGSTSMTIPTIEFSENDEQVFALEGVLFEQSIQPDQNGDLGGFFKVNIDAIDLPKVAEIPPQLADMSTHFNVGVSGVEKTAFLEMIDAQQSMSQAQMNMLNNIKESEAEDIDMSGFEESMSEYFITIANLIKQDTAINMDLGITAPKGSSNLAMDLNYTDARNVKELNTTADIIQALKGALKIHIDKSLVEGTPLEEMLGMPVAMGFAVADGKGFSSNAELANAIVKLNGQEMPVLEMLGPEAEQPLPWVQ